MKKETRNIQLLKVPALAPIAAKTEITPLQIEADTFRNLQKTNRLHKIYGSQRDVELNHSELFPIPSSELLDLILEKLELLDTKRFTNVGYNFSLGYDQKTGNPEKAGYKPFWSYPRYTIQEIPLTKEEIANNILTFPFSRKYTKKVCIWGINATMTKDDVETLKEEMNDYQEYYYNNYSDKLHHDKDYKKWLTENPEPEMDDVNYNEWCTAMDAKWFDDLDFGDYYHVIDDIVYDILIERFGEAELLRIYHNVMREERKQAAINLKSTMKYIDELIKEA